MSLLSAIQKIYTNTLGKEWYKYIKYHHRYNYMALAVFSVSLFATIVSLSLSKR